MKRSIENLSSSSKELENETKEESKIIDVDQLCSNLTSTLLPQNKDMASQADQIEEATKYIIELKERVEGLNKRKEQLQTMNNNNKEGPSNYQGSRIITTSSNSRLPMIEVKEMGTSLEVQLVMELHHNNIMLHQVITILEEEGAEVVNATFSTSANQVTQIFHAKARSSRVGIEASRVRERLHELMRFID